MPRKPKLTPQQRSLVKNLAKGMNITNAAISAGYSDNGCAGQIGSQALRAIERKMPAVLDAHGLTDDVLVEKYLRPLLEAENTEFAKFEGKITDERNVAAWRERSVGLDMCFNLKGSYAPKQAVTSGESSSNITVNVMILRPDDKVKVIANEQDTESKK
jgi:hypothetical protein